MMAKYTPRTLVLKARKPKTAASTPGTTATASVVKKNEWNGFQKRGSSFTRFQTMKSGSLLW